VLAAGCRGLLGIDDPRVVDAGSSPPTVDAPGPDAPPPTAAEVTKQLVEEWSGCMSLASFTTAKMTDWADVNAGANKCQSCHAVGEYGFIASMDADQMFAAISTNKYMLLAFFVVDLSNGTTNAKIITNVVNLTAAGSGQPPHQQHPTYPAMNAGTTALGKFYDSTMARKIAGACDPPRLTF
jgi:hypothetical protein